MQDRLPNAAHWNTRENYKKGFITCPNNWMASKAVAFRSMLKKSVARMYGGQEALAGMSFTTIGLTVCLAASSSGASIGLRL